MLTIAGNLHCMDCEEARMQNPRQTPATLETAEHLWETIQVDNVEYTYGEQVFH